MALEKSGVLSVKELLSPDRRHASKAAGAELFSTTLPLKLDDEAYVIPKYCWKKPKFLGDSRQAKLDYINLFPEKTHPNEGELTKIHAKRKNTTPGPNYYETTHDWAKKSPHMHE